MQYYILSVSKDNTGNTDSKSVLSKEEEANGAIEKQITLSLRIPESDRDKLDLIKQELVKALKEVTYLLEE